MRRFYHKWLAAFGLLLLLTILFWQYLSSSIEYIQGTTMGTSYHVSYVRAPSMPSANKIKRIVHQALDDIDVRMSTYKTNSELLQLNRSPLNKPTKVSPDLARLIMLSQKFSKLSDGFYDVTAGTLVNLWGFGPSKELLSGERKSVDTNTNPNSLDTLSKYQPVIPTESEVQAALKNVSYRSVLVDLEQDTVTRLKPVFIDLSSIAKGHGVDRAVAALQLSGVVNFLVEVGGEVAVRGKKSDDTPWRIAIRGPGFRNIAPEIVIHLENQAVATSGDYLNYHEVEGKQYAHVIDPRTGFPKQSSLAAVSVIASSCAEADAMATMLMLLGAEKGLAFANKMGYSAAFTHKKKDVFQTDYTSSFISHLVISP